MARVTSQPAQPTGGHISHPNPKGISVRADTAPATHRVEFSDFTPEITAAPLLGEHTDDVLASLGYDAEAIATMHADQVVA